MKGWRDRAGENETNKKILKKQAEMIEREREREL